MKSKFLPVDVAVEKWTIPTYPIPEAEEMPMFAETSVHQGTTGNPYPNRVVSAADGEHRSEKEWTVIRLENEYIRLAVIPALGGRIFEAYDKVTGYDFLYRQHVIYMQDSLSKVMPPAVHFSQYAKSQHSSPPMWRYSPGTSSASSVR